MAQWVEPQRICDKKRRLVYVHETKVDPHTADRISSFKQQMALIDIQIAEHERIYPAREQPISRVEHDEYNIWRDHCRREQSELSTTMSQEELREFSAWRERRSTAVAPDGTSTPDLEKPMRSFSEYMIS